MSTILDALRKLQRQRELAQPPQNLQESVTQQISQARPPRRRSSRFVRFGLIALLLVLVGGALIWKWPPLRGTTPEAALLADAKSASGRAARPPVTRPPAARRGKRRLPPAAPSRQPLADAAVPSPSPIPPATEPAVRPGPRAELLAAQAAARVTSAKPTEESTRVEPGASAPSPAAVKPTPPPELAAAQKPAKPKPAAKSRVSGRRQRDRRGSTQEAAAARVSAPKPPPAASTVPPRDTRKASAEIKPPPKSTPTTPLKTVTPPAQVAKLAEAERASQPEPSRQESNPFLEPFEPMTRVERSSAVTQEVKERPPALAAPDFPELALESVRWHPDPSRRVANLVLDRARGVTVREGDIVRGALIYRIDPGAVELRVGTAKKRLQMGP